MRRSLYARLLATYLGVMMLALIGLGFLFSQMIVGETYTQKRDMLRIEAGRLAQYAARDYFTVGQVTKNFGEDLIYSAGQYKIDVWLVNLQGNVMQVQGAGQPAERSIESEQLKGYLSRIMNGETVETMGNLNGVYSRPMLTLGMPAKDQSGAVLGAIFVHTPMDEMNMAFMNIYTRVSWLAIMSAGLGAVLMALVTARITRPLKQMNLAASEIAHGKFDRRVEVTGDDEVGQLARNFNKMAEELKKLEELRGGFVANVSHELRSPMTSMQGFVQGMLDGTIPPEQRDYYLDIVLQETKRLTRLVNDLLDLSKMESGNFPLQCSAFELNERIRRVLIRYEGRIDDKHLQVQVDFRSEICMVWADPDRIDQVLSNLIDNAIKFTPEGGQLDIWTYTSTGKAFCCIKDSGIGLTEDQLPFIFERFYKADTAHTPGRGTGLGLSIVKKIIEEHGQTIEATSQAGKGTSFVFSLVSYQEKGKLLEKRAKDFGGDKAREREKE